MLISPLLLYHLLLWLVIKIRVNCFFLLLFEHDFELGHFYNVNLENIVASYHFGGPIPYSIIIYGSYVRIILFDHDFVRFIFGQ